MISPEGTPAIPRLSPLGTAPIPERARGRVPSAATPIPSSARAALVRSPTARDPPSPPAAEETPAEAVNAPPYHRQSYRLPIEEGPRLLDRIAADAGRSRKLDRVDVLAAILTGVHRSGLSFEGVAGGVGIAEHVERCLRAGARALGA